MIRTGQTIENPVTGEVLIFHKTSRDTGGEYVLVETVLRPGASVAAAHSHPHQAESFAVLEGQDRDEDRPREGRAASRRRRHRAGGTPHKFWNAGDGEARFTCEVRPAGAFEQLIETMFTLAADGKTSKRGMPNPLRLAVIARHHFNDVRLPVIPFTPSSGRLSRSARRSARRSGTARPTKRRKQEECPHTTANGADPTRIPQERPHANGLERIHLLRPGQHPRWPGSRDHAEGEAVGRELPHAASRVQDADPPEALVPAPIAR